MDFNWLAVKVSKFWQRFWCGMEQSIWDNLPDVAIIEIFKYLNDKDRASAALTCKNWARLFQTPCLWRSRHLDMGGYQAHSNGLRACQFADKFGAYIRYLTISCSHPSYHTTKIFQKAMEEFLVKLRLTQLIEFEMERLELDRYWKYEVSRDRLISNLTKFFKSQKFLRVFDMTAAQFPLPGGCKVLDAIGMQSGYKIRDLYIEDFFHSRLAVFQVKRFRTALSRFTDLRYIALNYNCISEDTLETFTRTLEGKLEGLNIKIYRNDPHFHRISGFAWKMLCHACPKLTVTLWFECVATSNVIIPILVKEMPLKEVHLWTGYDDDADWRLSNTISHMAEMYTGTLEALSLELDNNNEIVDEALMILVQRCKKLVELNVNAIVLLESIEAMCQLQEEKKINLESFHVTACGLSESEWTELCIIKDKFGPMIQERNLDFKFTTDLLIDPSM